MNEPVCIIRFYPYPQESHVKRDAECLLEAGYRVDVIAARARGQKAREVVDGIHVYRLPIAPGYGSALGYFFRYYAFFILCFFAISWLQLTRRYRVIEVDTMPDFLVFATFIPKLLGTRIVLYLFEAMPELFSARRNLADETAVVKTLKAIERWAVKYSDHVFTVNEMHRELVSRRSSAGDKVSVVLNVPDEKRLAVSVEAPPDKGQFLLIYHGTIAVRYGVHTAIKALGQLRDNIEGIRLLVLGNGDYKSEIVSLTRELELEKHVEFINWVPYEELIEWISRADIGLVPFIIDGYTDLMLPNKLFEYIGLGVPVVSARTKAIRDYYNEGCLAFFEPGDEHDLARAVLDLHQDPAKREELSKNAKELYETRHRWGIMKERYVGVYRRLLSAKE